MYYTKVTDRFVAEVDRIYYGGRKPKIYPLECCATWRHKEAKYCEWNGSKWVRLKTINHTSWQDTGPANLTWWNLTNGATLDGGAYVTHRLEYRKFQPIIGEVKWEGWLHEYFLE